jgi:hypothetical protein
VGNFRLYSVHQTKREHVSEGMVWIRNPVFEAWSGLRPVVRIESFHGRVYCELLYADAKYMDDRITALPEEDESRLRFEASANDQQQTIPLLFIGEWYRRRLGLTAVKGRYCLDVTVGSRWKVWRQLWAGFMHPQSAVFLAAILAMVGIDLGLGGLGFGLLSLDHPHLGLHDKFGLQIDVAVVSGLLHWVGAGFVLLGLASICLTIRPLVKRSKRSKDVTP